MRSLRLIVGGWQQSGVGAIFVPTPPQLVNDREYTATFPSFRLGQGPADADALRGLRSAATLLPSNNFTAPSPINGSRYMSPELDGLIASYFRTVPRFETAAPRYVFLNRLLAVGTAEIRAEGPVHLIEEIL